MTDGRSNMWSSTKTEKVQLDKCTFTATVSMDWNQEAAAESVKVWSCQIFCAELTDSAFVST